MSMVLVELYIPVLTSHRQRRVADKDKDIMTALYFNNAIDQTQRLAFSQNKESLSCIELLHECKLILCTFGRGCDKFEL